MLACFGRVDENNSAREIWSLLKSASSILIPRVDEWWYERRFEPFFTAL
jgi:hypothetical protein